MIRRLRAAPLPMSHSQIPFSDMSQVYNWNPLMEGEAPGAHNEELCSTTAKCVR